MISDIMSFTKEKNVPGAAVFLDSEKAFGSIEWNYLLEVLRFGPELREWIKVVYNDISSSVLHNGYASEHFSLSRSSAWVSACQLFRTHGRFVSRPFVPKLRWFAQKQLVLFLTHFVCVGISFSTTWPKQRLTVSLVFVAEHWIQDRTGIVFGERCKWTDG